MLTTREAATLIGVSIGHMQDMIRKGIIPAVQYRRNGQYRIDAARLQRGYIRGNDRDPMSQAKACWMLLCRGKRDQARNVYCQLTTQAKEWIDGHVAKHGWTPLDKPQP